MKILRVPEYDAPEPRLFPGLLENVQRERVRGLSHLNPTSYAGRDTSSVGFTSVQDLANPVIDVTGVTFQAYMWNHYLEGHTVPFHHDMYTGEVAIASFGDTGTLRLAKDERPPGHWYEGPSEAKQHLIVPDYLLVMEHGDVVFLDEITQSYWLHSVVNHGERWSLIMRRNS